MISKKNSIKMTNSKNEVIFKRNPAIFVKVMILVVILFFSGFIYIYHLDSLILGLLYFTLATYGIVKCIWGIIHPYIVLKTNEISIYSDLIIPTRHLALSLVTYIIIEPKKIIFVTINHVKFIVKLNMMKESDGEKFLEIIETMEEHVNKK